MFNENLIHKNRILGRILEEIPEFTYLGDQILRTPTEEVSIEEGKMIGKKLGEVLVKYRQIAGFGRGLAAPQIGIGKSVFVTFLDNKLEIYINPEIVDVSEGLNFFRELCLSSTFIEADVRRHEWVVLRWFDENGVEHKEKFDGLKARLIQHEFKHLLGIPNVDEAEPGSLRIAGDPLQEKLRSSRLE